MDSNKVVNAAFNLDSAYKVQIERTQGDVYFYTLQSAINSALSGETAKSRGDVSFDENIFIDTGENVSISGGYSTDYTLKSGVSILNGLLKIKRGTLVVSDLIIAGGTDTTPPTVPANLTGTVVNSSQINLSWSPSTDNVDVAGYRLERCQGVSCSSFSQIATPTTPTFNDTGLTASTRYSYRVLAVDDAGNPSGYSDSYSAVTLNASPPSAPAFAAATAQTATRVSVTWTDASDNETGFRVLRGTGTSPASYTQVGSDLGANAMYFNDTTATANTIYVYRVTAFNDFGVSAPAQTAPVTTPIPASGANLSGPSSATTGTPFTLSWTYSWGTFGSTAEGYELQESTSSTFSSPVTLLDTRNTGDRVSPKTFQVTKNTPGTYYYRVRANTIAGFSAWSNILIVMVTQATSTTITLTAQYDNLVMYMNRDPNVANNVYQYDPLSVGCMWLYTCIVLPDGELMCTQDSTCFQSLVIFNLNTLAGKTVDNATLKLVVKDKGPGSFARTWFVRALATSWLPTNVTWNIVGQADYYIYSENILYPPQMTGLPSYEIDVTDTVRNWLNGTYSNNGLLFGSTDYTFPLRTEIDSFEFYNKEDPAGEGPKLIVTYH